MENEFERVYMRGSRSRRCCQAFASHSQRVCPPLVLEVRATLALFSSHYNTYVQTHTLTSFLDEMSPVALSSLLAVFAASSAVLAQTPTSQPVPLASKHFSYPDGVVRVYLYDKFRKAV